MSGLKSATPLRQTVEKAQFEISQAIRLGQLDDDPLRYPLEAISDALGVIKEMHETAAAEFEKTGLRVADQISAAGVQIAEVAQRKAENRANEVFVAGSDWLVGKTREATTEMLEKMELVAARTERASRSAAISAYIAGIGALVVFGIYLGNFLADHRLLW